MSTEDFTETIISDPYAHAHELAVRPGRDADEVRLDATGHGRTVTIVVPAVELRAALDRAAAQEPTDAELAVRELHTPRNEQVITGDCATEECDHEDRCPTVPHPVCTECSRLAEEATPYYAENGIEFVSYPCRTIRTLDAALSAARAARRDEEKRDG